MVFRRAMTDRANLPLPDELAAIRAEIKRLEGRESDIRSLLLSNPDCRTGASWLAEIRTVQQNRTAWAELRAAHPALVDEYTHSLPVTHVVLSGIDPDTGEIIPARKFRKATESQSQ